MQAVDESQSLSGSSKNSYKKQLRSVIRIGGDGSKTSLSNILVDPEKAMRHLTHIADNSLRSYLAAILSLFKRGEEQGFFKRTDGPISELYHKWMNQLQQSSRRYTDRIDDNVESAREIEAHTSMSDWVDAYNKAAEKSPWSQSTLLLALHALVLPPLRGGDLGHVKIGYTPTGNCVYKTGRGTWELIVRDHKTSKSFGELKRTITGEAAEMLEDSIEAEPREWLFVTLGGSPYSDSGFSSWKSNVFKDVFGRRVTTNSLRHAFVSSMDRQHQSLRDAQRIASSMGHGLHTQRQYVRL